MKNDLIILGVGALTLKIVWLLDEINEKKRNLQFIRVS